MQGHARNIGRYRRVFSLSGKNEPGGGKVPHLRLDGIWTKIKDMSRYSRFAAVVLVAVSLYGQVPAPPAPRLKTPKVMPGDEPDKAQEFYVMKRAGEGVSDLPYEKYKSAQERAGRMRHYSLAERRFIAGADRKRAASVDLGGWEALGPGNQGGRTPALIIHPGDARVMYAGAATGGVWKTVDGGANWRPVSDAFPSLGIGALAFEPGNPETVYAGTGFWFNSLSVTNNWGSAPRGAGIFRSRDGGGSWEQLPMPAGTHFRYINEIIVSPRDVNRIYAATWTGVHRSRDGGQTWERILSRSAASQNGCQDLVMRPDTATDYLFASCVTAAAGGPAILRKEDGAADGEWQTVFSNRSAGNTKLAIAPSNPGMIYALVASNGADSAAWNGGLLGVWRSAANGDPDTWEARVTNADENPINAALLANNQSYFANVCFNGTRSTTSQGWIHNAIAVDPQDAERVYVGGIDIFRSDDGGRNWGYASFWQEADGPNGAHADVLALVFPPDYDGNERPILYAATDGGVYITDRARGEVAAGVRAACSPRSTGVRWRPLHTGMQTTQFYTGAVVPGGGAFFGGKQDNGTMRGSLADRRNWLRLAGGDGAAVAVDPRNANTFFVSTQGFNLARTRNGGGSFTGVLRGITEPSGNFAFIAPLAMDQTNPDRLYAGARYFYRTDNQADQWTRISSRLLDQTEGYVTAVAVAPSDASRVLFATSTGYVFRTANALEATAETVWEAERPRPGFVPAITFDPNNADVAYMVYSQFNTAAGQNHIYRTTDGGRTWEGIDRAGEAGIPDIPVLSVTVDPQDAQRLYVGTDLGVFVSLDGGVSWARDQSPFAAVPVESLQIDRGAGVTYLYAFTFGRGVWRTMLPGTGTPCEYKLTAALPGVSPAYGGAGAFQVETGPECVWTAIGAGAVTVQSPPTGKGSGALQAAIPINISSLARTYAITVQEQAVLARQAGAAIFPAAADRFETAAAVESLPYVGVRDTRPSTFAPETDRQPSCLEGVEVAKTNWLRVTAPAAGRMEVQVMGQRYDIFGNSGVVVTAYPADAAGGMGEELACGIVPRDLVAWRFGAMEFPVAAGASYYLQVGATGSGAQDGGYTVVAVRFVP
jgi:photosystem II stability/assembly factor-like uncharacterized protein